MMDKNKAIKISRHFFDIKKSLEEIFITDDGQAFENGSNAFAHAKTLEGRPEPVRVSKEDLFDVSSLKVDEEKEAKAVDEEKEAKAVKKKKGKK